MEKIGLRKFPYPFKSALSICSDIDGTHTAEEFLYIQTFLNTQRMMDIGPGVGLEIGNSFIPLRLDNRFAYFSNRPYDRFIIKEFIKAGVIECIHSYGEIAQKRQEIITIIEALEKDDCKLKTWVDHSRVPSNLGFYNSRGLGDLKESPVYHADITLKYGIRFAWMGRSTSLVGQETPLTLKTFSHLIDFNHPNASLGNLFRELIKINLSKLRNRRFSIHNGNRLIRIASLRDGNRIFEFIRCNNHWHKPWPSSPKLAYMLRPKALQALKASNGYSIFYTHFGFFNPPDLIPPETQAALRHLAEEFRSGEILVTTTTRLLTYCLTHRYLKWDYNISPEKIIHITIKHIDDPLTGPRLPTMEEIQGLTFYIPDRHKASLALSEKPLPQISRNEKDHLGRESISVPWIPLTYPF